MLSFNRSEVHFFCKLRSFVDDKAARTKDPEDKNEQILRNEFTVMKFTLSLVKIKVVRYICDVFDFCCILKVAQNSFQDFPRRTF